VLWLLERERQASANLRQEARSRGVDPSRLVFARWAELPAHLARYKLVDLCLDTFPYTSHTTASDALWAGCPLVTAVGETFASRVAGSLLKAAGVPELATHSLAEAEDLAVRLANDPAGLASLKNRLAAERERCALFDTPRFVRHLEQAFAAMWSIREAGDPPRDIRVGGTPQANQPD
jgi:predicted O-linked N-acetylglucosamine transferase (SPINDLY family)